MNIVSEIKTCMKCARSFSIVPQESNFLKEHDLAKPVKCPQCRKNEREFWMTTPNYQIGRCQVCNKEIFIPFQQVGERPPICEDCREEWRRNNPFIDNLAYVPGKFLEQYNFLISKTPVGLYDIMYSDEYAEHTHRSAEISFCKNSYDCYDLSKCLDCVDVQNAISNTMCSGTTFSNNCQYCKEVINSSSLNLCKYMQNCYDCRDCAFCDNCVSCRNCYGCSGLRDRENYIFNKRYTLETYKAEVKRLQQLTINEQIKKVNGFVQNIPVPQSINNGNSQDCYYGTNIESSKSCYYAIISSRNTDSGYIWHCEENTNCWDLSICRKCEDSYSISGCTYSNRIFFSTDLYECNNCYYCSWSRKIADCIGCVNEAPDSRFKILNMQYTQEDYKRLLQQIKNELNLHYK